jgi:THO complex subunit 1
MAAHGMQAVEDFGKLLQEMLERAQLVKQTNTIEPPLNKSDLPELWDQLEFIFPSLVSQESKKHIIEAAVRDVFNNLLVSHTSVRAQEHISDVP